MADKTTGGLGAVTEAAIGDLPGIADLYDDTLLPVEQQGEARHMTGAQWKRYAQAGVSQYVEGAHEAAERAAGSAQDAAGSAKDAEDSALSAKEYSGKPPIIQNGTWWTWNASTTQYEDSGEAAQGDPGRDGTSFVVSGRYDTLDELTEAHPSGGEGEAWAVGSAEENSIYLWDLDAQSWKNIGSLQGPPGSEGPEGRPGQQGEPGSPGPGVPAGGSAGQVLTKASDSDYDAKWSAAPEGGVSSFNGRAGAVAPRAGDYSVEQITGAAPIEGPVFSKYVFINPDGLPDTVLGEPGVGSLSVGARARCYGEDSVALGQNTLNGGINCVFELGATVYPVAGDSPSGSVPDNVLNSHVEGNIQIGNCNVFDSHIEGSGSIGSIGVETRGEIYGVHMEAPRGGINVLHFSNSHLEGAHDVLTIESVTDSHVEGASDHSTIDATSGSHIEGRLSAVKVDAGYGSHVEGFFGNTEISVSEGAHVEGCLDGFLSKATMNPGHCGNGVHIGGTNVSFADDVSTWLCNGAFLHGVEEGISYDADSSHGAAIVMGSMPNTTVDRSIFILGQGSFGAKGNSLRVTHDAVFGGTYRSTGADYAELFEWADGNDGGEDRAGRFVTLEGDKIRLANADDGFILGVVSGDPSVVGDNHDDQWHGMYARDVFGRILFETLEYEEQIEEIPHPTKDNPGNTRSRVIPAHTKIKPRLNPDYNPEEKYVPRSKRSEWDAVGMMGKLVVVDDGTCVVDGWCRVGEGSAAVKSEERTRFRVMRRIDGSHVQILVL